jgi:F-type H+-transporting ATPase subunit c
MMNRIGRTLVSVLALVVLSPGLALAADGGGGSWSNGIIALAAGLGLGIAAFGAALGQGRATAAAMESIGRNPNSADRIFTPAFVIAIILQGKVV